MGPTPDPRPPPVHRYGWTALHWAAEYGNRRIIGLLVDANAAVNAQADYGWRCADCACGKWAVECAAPSRRRRLPCRETPLHIAMYRGHSSSGAELLLRGADGAVQDNVG